MKPFFEKNVKELQQLYAEHPHIGQIINGGYNISGTTCLINAIEHRKIQIVCVLLSKGFNFDQSNSQKENLLDVAVRANYPCGFIRYLITLGLDGNSGKDCHKYLSENKVLKYDIRNTPVCVKSNPNNGFEKSEIMKSLEMVIYNRNYQMAEMLLNIGADQNYISYYEPLGKYDKSVFHHFLEKLLTDNQITDDAVSLFEIFLYYGVKPFKQEEIDTLDNLCKKYPKYVHIFNEYGSILEHYRRHDLFSKYVECKKYIGVHDYVNNENFNHL